MLFAVVGSAGSVILFVCVGVLWILVAAHTLAYAAHCYLVVVQGTAAGLDRVEWPDEPMIDWIYRALYLGGLVLIWMLPVGLLSRALQDDWLPGQNALRFLLLAGLAMWFFFPLSLLSSLGSTSPWAVLSWRVLQRLGRILPSVLVFYLTSAALLYAAATLAYAGVLTGAVLALPFAGIAVAAALLIHARLVGRLGWLVSQLDVQPARAGKRKAKPAAPATAGQPARVTAAQDPWAVAERQGRPEGAAAAGLGYRVVELPEAQAPPAGPSYLDNPDPDPYTVAAAPAAAPEELRLPALQQAQVEREIKLRSREAPNPPPAIPLFSGVYTFPTYPTSQQAWMRLTLFCLATLGVTRLLVELWPF
jgi:hypothetical protein